MSTASSGTTKSLATSQPAKVYFDSAFRDIAWHQKWEVFPGIWTPGHNDVAKLCAAIQLPQDLRGKRVLDVGAWHGCFSFECERRGAAEVVALSLEDPEKVGFNRLKKLLNSTVRYVKGSAYTMSPRELGTFDVVLFLGVLYHLRYPLLAIDRLRSMCHDEIFVETFVIDRCRWLRNVPRWTKHLLRSNSVVRSPIWRQYREFELHPNDQSNWFGPNVVAVIESFESAGFSLTHTQSWDDRAGFRGRVVDIPACLATDKSYEGFSENVELVRPATV